MPGIIKDYSWTKDRLCYRKNKKKRKRKREYRVFFSGELIKLKKLAIIVLEPAKPRVAVLMTS